MGYNETGRLFERRVIGECTVSYQGHLCWKEAAAQVRKNQPKQLPKNATDLLAEVRRQTKADVQFYTAIGSALDYFHGVDGFFEFAGFVVTIDVTKNPHKDCGKANMVVCEDDLEDLPALAGRVVREFVTQARRAGI